MDDLPHGDVRLVAEVGRLAHYHFVDSYAKGPDVRVGTVGFPGTQLKKYFRTASSNGVRAHLVAQPVRSAEHGAPLRRLLR